MSKRTVFSGARSYRRGELASSELGPLASLFNHPSVREQALEAAADIDNYALDFLLIDGDALVNGDVDLGDTGYGGEGDAEGTVLVVRGNLTVTGLYRDACNDAPDSVLVTGTLRARNVITASCLEVQGDLLVDEVLVGDFSDGRARVVGNVSASLFVPGDHSFVIDGKVRSEWFIKAKNECRAADLPPPCDWSEVPLAEFPFSRADPDVSTLIKRLRAHQPVLRARS